MVCPSVISKVAAEGPELSDDLVWPLAHLSAEFVEKLALVHEDDASNWTLADAGLPYIEAWHGAEVVTEALRAAVAG
jgi:hypothetical protein